MKRPTNAMQEVLFELNRYPELTGKQLMHLTDQCNPIARIFHLRKRGVFIKSRFITVNNKYGRSVSYVSYSLDKEQEIEGIYDSL